MARPHSLPTEGPVAGLVARLRTANPCPALAPRQPVDPGIKNELDGKDVPELFSGRHVVDADYARAVRSGLYLWNDCLAEAHTLAQSIENQTGSYWHGIMHRREPDYNNSRYWFRRVGEHPIFPALREAALELLGSESGAAARKAGLHLESAGQWDPFAFIGWCESAERGTETDPAWREALEALQGLEMELLLGWSYRKALGEAWPSREE